MEAAQVYNVPLKLDIIILIILFQHRHLIHHLGIQYRYYPDHMTLHTTLENGRVGHKPTLHHLSKTLAKHHPNPKENCSQMERSNLRIRRVNLVQLSNQM